MLGNNLCQSHANKKTVRHQENPAIQSAKSILVLPISLLVNLLERVRKSSKLSDTVVSNYLLYR